MVEPWTVEKRAAFQRKIEKETARAAKRLGVPGVVMIAFVPDGDHFHIQDGGTSPMGLKELYTQLATGHEMVEETGGGWKQ